MWTTAYVGYQLCLLPPTFRHEMDRHLAQALIWLRRAKLEGQGWGYSARAGPDADSTALAILFARAQGQPMHGADLLTRYQKSDGGFATFVPGEAFGAWTQSHVEVTATALLALLDSPIATPLVMASGLEYLRSRQRPDGLWDSYWWTSCLYATLAALRLLGAARQALDRDAVAASLLRVPTLSAFDTALLLMCLLQLGAMAATADTARSRSTSEADRACAELRGRLQSAQQPDGSWLTQPTLRLTDRCIREPWLHPDAGPVFADIRRVFTTATVVAALGQSEAATVADSAGL